MRKLLLACALGTLFMMSCESIRVPTTIAAMTLTGYPDIHGEIIASLDRAMAIVDAAAARDGGRDSRYATLRRALRRQRDMSRRCSLRQNCGDVVTEKEREEIDSLFMDDPELDAAFGKEADALAAVWAAIPTIEVIVQDFDENCRPVGERHTVHSGHGTIDVGYGPLTSEEFLRNLQALTYEPQRGFHADEHWCQFEFGSARTASSRQVEYFLDAFDVSGGDTNWVWWWQ
ncbi:MAG: hypothetical protein OXC31_08240 [Spirochaetaceae bacterium]|nr:hypothetical protein [Spirochaetaceae bacterium]